MPVTTTKQFAFRDALYDALVAAVLADEDVGDVVISRGYVDWTHVYQRKSIEMGATFDDEEWSAIGNRKKEEQFDLECRIVIQVEGEGNDQMLLCEQEAAELFAIVGVALRLDTQMDETVDWCLISSSNYGPFYNEQGRVGVLEFTITAHAQLPRS